MNKLILLGALFFASLSSHAQVNPHEGYLITNSNDTIFGTIDYLSDEKCANECLFKATNDLDFKAYKPNEIKGYRFFRDGVFYVSKNFPVDGVEKTFFAEYLVKGGISLYHYRKNGQDYYFFENQEGNVAQMKELEFQYESSEEQRMAIRENLKYVSQILKKDPNTVTQLNSRTRVSEKSLVNLVKKYDEKFCTADGECIQFEYETKASTSSSFRLLAEAGVEFSSMTLSPANDYYAKGGDLKMESSVVPVVGIGSRIFFPRFSNHFYVDALLKFGFVNTHSNRIVKKVYGGSPKVKYTNGEIKLDFGYNILPDKKLSPIVHLGILASEALNVKIENAPGYGFQDMTGHCFGLGLTGGLGADYKLGNHHLGLSVDYLYRSYGPMGNKVNGFAANLKFVL